MPLYEYKAYDAGGKKVKGLIDAPSQASAHGKLKKQGYFPTDISQDTGRSYTSTSAGADMIFALEQLCTLLRAGIALPEALDSLVNQLENDQLKRAFARVKVHLEEGDSLANSLATEGVFPPVLVKMVEAGEAVGTVEIILERYADFMEKEMEFREKIISSMLYPVIIMVASFSLIFFVLTYIAPTLVKIFASFHQEMPLATRILLHVGSFLRNNFVLILLIIALGVFSYLKIIPREAKDNLILRIPFFNTIHIYIQMSRWSRTLAMLHGGGVSLLKALASSREVVDNRVIKKDLKMVEDYVQKGEGLGSALNRVPSIPSLVVQMTKTGEKSGELEKLLNTAALFYENEVDKRLSVFFKFLEPAVIIFLGLVVGFVAISALLPIFEINKIIG